jgi:hypothetical protein
MTNGSTPLGWRGRHWNALEYPGRVFATGLTGGLRPINTAYLPTVDSVVENIVSHLQQFRLLPEAKNFCTFANVDRQHPNNHLCICRVLLYSLLDPIN